MCAHLKFIKRHDLPQIYITRHIILLCYYLILYLKLLHFYLSVL